MKNPALSFWLSSVNWWMGHAANAARSQQRAMLNEMMKPAPVSAPKPKRKPRRASAKRKTV